MSFNLFRSLILFSEVLPFYQYCTLLNLFLKIFILLGALINGLSSQFNFYFNHCQCLRVITKFSVLILSPTILLNSLVLICLFVQIPQNFLCTILRHLQMKQFFVVIQKPISHLLEKEIATHSSILAWRIPQAEEPGRLQGLQRVGHN